MHIAPFCIRPSNVIGTVRPFRSAARIPREEVIYPHGAVCRAVAVRSIASAMVRYKDGGRSCPIPWMGSHSAPRMDAAVSAPQASGNRASSVPCATRVGARIVDRIALRSLASTPRATKAGLAAAIDLGLFHPLVQRLRHAADLTGDRQDRRPARMVFSLVRTARPRTSGENLFVVLLVMAPSSQELEPPINPARVTRVLPPLSTLPWHRPLYKLTFSL